MAQTTLEHPGKISVFERFNISRPSHIFFELISILLVIAAYVWFISFGLWTRWPDLGNSFYNRLATSFLDKKLYIEVKPNAALLNLPDPYDPAARRYLNYLMDYSLYKGRYYLYFGPVPAFFMAFIKLLGFHDVGDQHLVFVFASGIFITQSLIIIKIRELFFKKLPDWMLAFCIVLGGLISPLTWTLTQARVYEAASTCGQFFFLGGFYFITITMSRKSISKFLLFVAGCFLSLAAGSRLIQILPVGFIILVVAYFVYKTHPGSLSSKLEYPAWVGLPVVLGTVILGWYNWARFGSIFETGFSYQLAGPPIQQYHDFLFSALYAIPNFYDYFITPFQTKGTFPFLVPVPSNGDSIFSFITLSKIYYSTKLTGLLVSTPFVVFTGVLTFAFLPVTRKMADGSPGGTGDQYTLRWTILGLFGSFLFGFAPMLVFFVAAPHYQIDFVPPLIILSITGFWLGYQSIVDKPALRRFYVALGIILILSSIIISVLLALSANAKQFQEFNPGLWNYWVNLFR